VDLLTDQDAYWIALYLLQSSRTPKADTEDSQKENFPTASWKQLKLSDDQRRELVELLTDAASSASANPNLANGLGEIMPEIQLFAPDRVTSVKAKMAQANATLTNGQQDWKTYESLYRTGTPQQMIHAANSTNGEQRQALYREAVSVAVMRNQADALRETINTEVPDDSQRKALIDLLDAEEIGSAVYQGNVDELQKLLPTIRLKEQRALAMAELAMILEKKGRHEEALKLLQDARPLVKIDFNSDTQSRAFLGLLLAYALIDPPQAFAMAEPIIDRANDNISKLLLVDKIVHTGAVKNGEIIMQDPGVPLDFALIKYGRGVVALANADFTRTKALADRFQRNELKLMARLLIAQSILRSLEAPDKPEAPTEPSP
jgi:tetratricopeptide (TPR) repeat protein